MASEGLAPDGSREQDQLSVGHGLRDVLFLVEHARAGGDRDRADAAEHDTDDRDNDDDDDERAPDGEGPALGEEPGDDIDGPRPALRGFVFTGIGAVVGAGVVGAGSAVVSNVVGAGIGAVVGAGIGGASPVVRRRRRRRRNRRRRGRERSRWSPR